MSNLVPVKVNERRNRPSASYIELYDACRGAYLIGQQVPESEKFRDESADAGTRIHEANEAGDLSLVEHISEADMVERIRQREEEIYLRWKDDHQITDAEIYREERLWLYDKNVALCSAKLDFYAVSRRKKLALVIDAKSGRKAVTPSPRNLQLRTAVVLLATNFGIRGARAAIVQPLVKLQPETEYTYADILNQGGALDQLLSLLIDIERPEAKRTPGYWCARCDASHICPEARERQQSLVTLKGLKWSVLSPEQKLGMWKLAKWAEPIIKHIKQNISADVERDPKSIPGLKRTPNTDPRFVASAIGVYVGLKERFPSLEATLNASFDAMVKMSVGKLEEFVREAALLKSKDEAEAWISTHLGEHIGRAARNGHVVEDKE